MHEVDEDVAEGEWYGSTFRLPFHGRESREGFFIDLPGQIDRFLIGNDAVITADDSENKATALIHQGFLAGYEVHIRFEGYAARVVGERLWHSTQAIRKLKPDGSVIEFQADLSGLEEITRWVLSWGSKAKVLGPPELRSGCRRN